MAEVIRASLHSYKSLATRKQLQVTLEVPAEHSAEALKMLGLADPSGTQWFALTRVQAPPEPAQRQTNSLSGAKAEPSKRFRDMPRSQQAALKCKDQNFQLWMMNKFDTADARWHMGLPLTGDLEATETAELTRRLLQRNLGISSKRELDADHTAAARWDALLTDYDTRAYQR